MENLNNFIKVALKTKYSQNDPRWKNSGLGTLGTIGAYGCLETDATNITNYYGSDETPLTVNEKMKANKGFVNAQGGTTNANLFNWSVFASLFKLKYSGKFSNSAALTKVQMDQIKSSLDKGYPVLLQIDTIPATSALDEHWITAIGYDGDDFIVHDPWDGAIKRITSWGVAPQTLIYDWCWFEGSVPKQGTVDVSMTIAKSERDFLVSRATVAKEVATYLDIPDPDHASIDTFMKTIAGIKGSITNLQTQLKDKNIDLEKAKVEVSNRVEQIARIETNCQNDSAMYLDQIGKLNDLIRNQPSVQGSQDTRVQELKEQVDTISKEKGKALLQVAEYKTKYEAAISAKNASENQVIAFLRKIFNIK